jgi:hypothetical protein
MWTPRSATTIASVLRRPATATEGLRTMLRTRFRIVFILLVLILLIVSALFGVLTYWLEAESLPGHSPTPGSTEEGDGLSSGLYGEMPLDFNLL